MSCPVLQAVEKAQKMDDTKMICFETVDPNEIAYSLLICN